ncbi:hypothetical protein [Paenibacillus sp. Y412MC10]|uniref:hypothetical protein n=1 Tax=Geobacillus sp. (strain Y412MC10) TaxID=481743 RepID=UPI0011A64DB6|nr:hypothetical protein [Paenibacillus sp. Y412MC10]
MGRMVNEKVKVDEMVGLGEEKILEGNKRDMAVEGCGFVGEGGGWGWGGDWGGYGERVVLF